MTILQQQGHASSNICPLCGMIPETIQHMHQCTHEGSCVGRTASVDAFQKWLETRNTDPDIMIFLQTHSYTPHEK